ncbi:MAG: hypothetical protein R3F62_11785 [Planctomycetota bacterium]
MHGGGFELMHRWVVIAFLALLCLGTCGHGLNTAFAQDLNPAEDVELEGEEAEAWFEEHELPAATPPLHEELAPPAPAPRALPRAFAARHFAGERRARGAFLPLLT